MAEKEKAETPEEAAFIEHYDRLTGALPIVKLLPKFISKRIITFSEQDKILAGETDSDKTKRFLEHITKHFSAGNTYTFYKFLEVVESHGGQYAYLAADIQKTIEQQKTKQQVADKEKGKLSQPVQVVDDTEEVTKMPQVQPDPSRMMTYAVGPPSQGEDLRSINLTAELVSVPVGEERVNGEEGRGAIGGAIGKSKKYHGSSHPDLPDLVEHVGSFVSTKWYELGLRLGVSVHILDSIEHDIRECNTACRKMFQAWLKDHRKGTWNDVIAALRSNSVKEDGVADKLEEMMTS